MIERLHCAREAQRKLAERGISLGEAGEAASFPVVIVANPSPRIAGSIWVIGPTGAGRFLTLVLDPRARQPLAWDLRTAWESSPAQISNYRRLVR